MFSFPDFGSPCRSRAASSSSCYIVQNSDLSRDGEKLRVIRGTKKIVGRG